MAFTFTNYAGMAPQGNEFLRNLVDSLAEGYAAGKLPERLRQESDYKQQQIEESKARALRERLMAESMPEQQRLKTALLNQQLQGLGFSNAQKQQEFERMQMLRNLLSGGRSSPQSEDYQQGQGAMAEAGRAEDLYPEDQFASLPVQRSASEGVVISKGDPSLYRIDDVYSQYPEYRPDIERMGYKRTVKTTTDPNTGMAYQEITYPSGKTEIVQSSFAPDRKEIEAERGERVQLAKEERQEARERGKELRTSITSAQKLIDVATRGKEKVQKIQDLISQLSSDFGPIAQYKSKWINDRRFGQIQSLLGDLVAEKAAGYSGNRVLANALNLARESKAQIADKPETAIGKLDPMLDSFNRTIEGAQKDLFNYKNEASRIKQSLGKTALSNREQPSRRPEQRTSQKVLDGVTYMQDENGNWLEVIQ